MADDCSADYSRPTLVNRRTFLACAAVTACASLSSACVARAASARHAPGRPALLHVGFRSRRGTGSIHTFALSGDRCVRAACTPSAPAAALAMHPRLPLLYLASGSAGWQSLPCGAVEAYAVDTRTGQLQRIARVLMSLSATGPRRLAVAPDGMSLLVSAFDGGIWNVFALDAHGLPASVASARKEVGTGSSHPAQASAHPHDILFPPGVGFAIGTDLGSDHLSLLQPSQAGIAVLARYRASPGAGPAHAALSATGRQLLVANVLQPSLSAWALQPSGNAEGMELHTQRTVPTGSPVTAISMHPDLPMAFTLRPEGSASRLESWHCGDGVQLAPASSLTLPARSGTCLLYREGLLWVAAAEGLLRVELAPGGALAHASHLLPLAGARALTLQEYETA